MLVRKFEAEDMASALKQVKDTLGAEALILSTRTLRKKGLGVLGKTTIEVTAAIESPAMRSHATPVASAKAPAAPTAQRIPAAYRGGRVELREDEDIQVPPIAAAKPAPRQENPLEEELRILRARLEAQDVSQLKAELDQLKGLVRQLSTAAPVAEAPPAPAIPASDAPPARRQQAASSLKTAARPELDDLIEQLTERGIDAEAAATIARFAAQRMNERQRREPQLCREFLTSTLADLVQVSGPLWEAGQPQRRVALVGPTGVGKTTTIAKLAAEAITASGARVALVTIDTYRIAAVEQLKVYGEIMGLPVEVVLSPAQLQEAIRRHRDKDLILIDTAGRSPRDAASIEELHGFLGAEAGIENLLVLAAPTDERLQQKTLESFGRLPIGGLIFTKLDETDRCGALINLPTRANLPLAYLTNGQQVPEDLLRAEPATVAQLVMESDTDGRRMAV